MRRSRARGDLRFWLSLVLLGRLVLVGVEVEEVLEEATQVQLVQGFCFQAPTSAPGSRMAKRVR